MTKTKTKPPKKKTEPLKQPASKEYRLLSVDTEKMPVELSQEERDRCAIELAELNEEAEKLTDLAGGRHGKARELIGNAVPVPAAEAIGRACMAAILSSRSRGLTLCGEPVWVRRQREARV